MSENLDVVGLGFDTSGYDRGIDHAEARLKELQVQVEASGKAITAAQVEMGKGAQAASSGAMPWPGMLTQAEIAEAKAQWNELYGDSGQAATNASDAAKAALAAAKATYEADSAEVKLAQVRGLLSPQEAAEAGRLNAVAYNEAVTTAMGRYGVTATVMPAEFSAMAGSLMQVGTAAEATGSKAALGAHGIGRLNQTLVGAIDRTRILSPAMGHLAYSLGSFAIGSVQMIPILLGFAALSMAWEKLKGGASDAAEMAKRAAQAYKDAWQSEEMGPGGAVGVGIQGAQQRIANLKGEAEDLAGAYVQGFGQVLPRLKEIYAEIAVEEQHLAEAQTHVEFPKQMQAWRDQVQAGASDIDSAIRQAGQHAAAAWGQTWDVMRAQSHDGWQDMVQGASDADQKVLAAMDHLRLAETTTKVQHLVDAWAAAPRSLQTSYDALDQVNKVLRENGVTLEQLPPFLQDYVRMMQGAGQVTKQQSEKMIAEYEQIQRTSDRLAGDIVDQFDNVITGTENVAQAFANMVDEILKEMARLAVQQEITKPLASWLAGFLGSLGGSAAGSSGGIPGAGAGPAWSSPGSAKNLVVHQQLNFNVAAMDAPSVTRVLQQNKGAILDMVGEGIRQSNTFRRAVRGN